MQITIKTLQLINFKIDFDSDKTVKELKEEIEKLHGAKEYPIWSQKLIYSGKILADDRKLSEYEIDEKKFLVLMITRPPPPPKQAPPETKASVPQIKEEPALASAAPKPKVSEEKHRPNTRSSSAAAASATGSSTNNSSTTSSSNPSSTSTAPSSARITTSTASIPNTTATSARPTVTDSNATGRYLAASDDSLNQDRSRQSVTSIIDQPHFRQIQELVQHSPHLISSTIEALAVSDPEMYRFISENPDRYVAALGNPNSGGAPTRQFARRSAAIRSDRIPDRGSQQVATALAAAATAAASSTREHVLNDRVVDQVLGHNVSEHDKEAIERLKELGFSEYLAIQAYMACDKDEELAANLLFQMDQ